MNLRCSLLAIFLLATLPAAARQSIGFQAGFGWSKIELNLHDGRDSRAPRLNLGVNYERFLTTHLSLGADLLFQQRGSRVQSFSITWTSSQSV